MHALRLTSLQAHSADAYCFAIADYLSRRLEVDARFFAHKDYRARLQALDNVQIAAAWICGMPYVQRAANAQFPGELLAAPVYQGARYAQRPIYFSDVVVRADSRFRNFSDLRGATWAFNDPNSQSGFHIVRHYLATTGRSWEFFGRITASDGHVNSLQMILDRAADAAALDSTVLDTELQMNPALRDAIRIVEILGPSPAPPWIISQRLPQSLRSDVRRALLQMHEDSVGGAALKRAGIQQLTAVTDADYDPIRQMAQLADAAGLPRDDSFLRLPHVDAAKIAPA